MSWKISGLLRGSGIPAPSGEHAVGCVDLMHQFEGDEHGGLLVRLFYPAELGPTSPASLWPAQYATWMSHPRYVKGFLDFKKIAASWLLSALTGAFVGPRIPAVYGASLLGNPPTILQVPQPVAQPPSSPRRASWHRSRSPEQEDTVQLDEPLADPPEEEEEEGVPLDAGFSEVSVVASSSSTVTHKPFPVIVFSHGLGANRCTYSAICCDLASHGYVVAAVEHRDRSASVSLRRVPHPSSTPEQSSFQDDWLEFHHVPEDPGMEFPLRDISQFQFRHEQVLQRSREAALALDLLTMLSEGADVMNMMEGCFDFKQFQGKLDIRKAAVMGHSFGGATTIQALSEDQRFLCGLALDTWMIPIHKDLLESGVQQPLLFINSFDHQWAENVRKLMKFTHPPDDRGVTPCRILTLRGTTHYDQTDIPFVLPNLILQMLKYSPQLDPTFTHVVNMDICLAFLKRYLHKDPSFLGPVPNLDGTEGHAEQIIFGTNVDLTGPSEEGHSQPPAPAADRVTGQVDHDQSGDSQHHGEEALKDQRQEEGRGEGEDTNQEEVEGDT